MTEPTTSVTEFPLLDLQTARAALVAARKCRNELICVAVAAGANRYAVAEAVGLHKSRIDQIVRWGE